MVGLLTEGITENAGRGFDPHNVTLTINSFQGIWILHDSISGKCQLIGPKYALYRHPHTITVSGTFQLAMLRMTLSHHQGEQKAPDYGLTKSTKPVQ